MAAGAIDAQRRRWVAFQARLGDGLPALQAPTVVTRLNAGDSGGDASELGLTSTLLFLGHGLALKRIYSRDASDPGLVEFYRRAGRRRRRIDGC